MRMGSGAGGAMAGSQMGSAVGSDGIRGRRWQGQADQMPVTWVVGTGGG